jgi:hypothetical protein
MKKVILFMVLFLMMVGCSYQEEPKVVDLKAETLKIKTVLEQYVLANEKQDFEIIQGIWAADDDIVLIGTDSDERLVGWKSIEKAIKNQFKQFQETYITVSEQIIRINEAGCSASFSELLAYNFIYKEEAKSFEGMRFTGVLEKIDGNWLLVQCHLSIPAEVEMNEVY